MTRVTGAHGFGGHGANLASPCLIDAVAASLAFSAISLCFAVVIAALSMTAGGDPTLATVLAAHS
jgi:hypothetical protein